MKHIGLLIGLIAFIVISQLGCTRPNPNYQSVDGGNQQNKDHSVVLDGDVADQDNPIEDGLVQTCDPNKPIRCKSGELIVCNASGDGTKAIPCKFGCSQRRCNECNPSDDPFCENDLLVRCDEGKIVKNKCSDGCHDGECNTSNCSDIQVDCDGVKDNGCEANLYTDIDHCGNCTTSCHGATQTCQQGVCLCLDGLGNCDGIADNGCETALDSNGSCPGCDAPCTADYKSPGGGNVLVIKTCVPGMCPLQCLDGWIDCDGNTINGCETPYDPVNGYGCEKCDHKGGNNYRRCGECGWQFCRSEPYEGDPWWSCQQTFNEFLYPCPKGQYCTFDGKCVDFVQ